MRSTIPSVWILAVLSLSLVVAASRAAEPVAVRLEEEGSEPSLSSPLPPESLAARVEALQTLGTSGLLLIPDSTNKRIMAFDPTSGSLVDADFIPSDPEHLASPIEVLLGPDGRTLLVSDLNSDAVYEYEILSGAFARLFAPAGGVNNAILDNIRGMAWRNGDLLVTNASGTNGDAVARFDSNGSYLGNFVGNGTGGLNSPWDIVEVHVTVGALTAGEWLVSGSDSDAIHHYAATGAALANLAAVDNAPQQLQLLDNGHLLVASFSGTQMGVLELDASGAVVGLYAPASLSGFRGVHELPSGRLLTTTGTGVYEVDRLGALVSTKLAGVSARYITKVGPWVESTPIAEASVRFDTEVHERRMYMLGHRQDGGGATDGSVTVFDLSTGTWTDTGVDLPEPVSNTTIAKLTDASGAVKLYVFGGRVEAGTCTTAVQSYAPATNTVSLEAADPWPGSVGGVPVFPGAVAVVANRAYAWGGFCSGAPAPYASRQTWIFDPLAPAGSRWSAGPDLPSEAAYQAGAALDGKLYSVGGDTYDGDLHPIDTVLRLDPANLAAGWQARTSIPMPSSGVAGCGEGRAFAFESASAWSLAGKIVLAGCGQWPNPLPDSFLYDAATNSWTSFPALGRGRRMPAGAFLVDSAASGRIWVSGGYVASGTNVGTATVETFTVTSPLLQSDGFESGGLGRWPDRTP